MQNLILVLSFGNVIFWILLGIFQSLKINALSEKVNDLESKLNRHYVHFENYNREIRKLLKISIHSYLEFLDQPLFDELPVYKEIDELKSILKEAGIIIEPPKNIEVPDPRGYSVKKVK